MAKAIERFRGLTRGHARLGARGDGRSSPRQAVSDGDSLSIELDGNLGLRMLGIDSPEKSFPLPGAPSRFVSLDAEGWEDYLTDPFSIEAVSANGLLELSEALRIDLLARCGAGAARNHRIHGDMAEDALEALIVDDLAQRNLTQADAEFFLAFARENMDVYGRLLAFINIDEPDKDRRPRPYNERLGATGQILPYLIWPNVDPFRNYPTLADAIPEPGEQVVFADQSPALRQVRDDVTAARAARIGLFETEDPLRLEAFEVRYLGRRRPPNRLVLDLSRPTQSIFPAFDYPLVLPEHRLWIPPEYLPLWEQKGWTLSPPMLATTAVGDRRDVTTAVASSPTLIDLRSPTGGSVLPTS